SFPSGKPALTMAIWSLVGAPPEVCVEGIPPLSAKILLLTLGACCLHRILRPLFAVLLPAFLLSIASALAFAADAPPEMKGAFRQPANNGWIYVHLQGTPREVGFQNGYLLAPEIADMLKVVKLESAHDYKKDWAFFRDAAQNMMWPHIEPEYREELKGIAEGATAHGVKIDVWDVIGINASTEWAYYNGQYDKEHGVKSPLPSVPEH